MRLSVGKACPESLDNKNSDVASVHINWVDLVFTVHWYLPKRVGLAGRRQAYSATETKHVGIRIRLVEEIVPDDLDGDDAEGDAIPTVTQCKIGVRKPGLDPNVNQTITMVLTMGGEGRV